MTMGLTEVQAKALTFIRRRVAAGGVAPTYAEIAEALGIKSKSGAHRVVDELEERGHVRRLPRRRRALEVVTWPQRIDLNQLDDDQLTSLAARVEAELVCRRASGGPA